jgi:potassium-transporting ATPase KdpC subunit
MKTQIITALKFLVVLTFLTGIIYPLVMTGTAQIIYHSKANGSLITNDGKVIGSDLIGQNFDSIIYFWSRPSVIGYNPVPSGASNYGPTSDTLRKLATSRLELFALANSVTDKPAIPKEMIYASGSGLDPHISQEAALLQVDRISDARHLSSAQKEKLIEKIKELTEAPQFLILGQERVNVMKLNIELNEITKNN